MEELEPPTSAKVIMYTTCGPLEIELWGLECPRSVRAFLQLCLEGYYEQTTFHRCLPGYLVQGGDPTGTGEGGEAPGGPLALESHPRLHWTRRGLLGLAPAEETCLAGSQFFLTLAPTPELDRRATLIGRVVGQTIYNLVQLGEAPRVPGSERFAEPAPRIISITVIENPWDDIIPRELPEVQARRQVTVASLKSKSLPEKKTLPKAKTGRQALSFVDEEEEEAGGGERRASSNHAGGRIKSSHEVLHNDPSLSQQSVTVTMERDIGQRRRDQEPSEIVNVSEETSVILEQLRKERRAAIDQVATKVAQVREELKAMRTITVQAQKVVAGNHSQSPPPQDSLSKFLGVRKRTLPVTKDVVPTASTGEPTSKLYKERKRLLVGRQRRTNVDEMDTLLVLNAFRDKLQRVEDPLRPGLRKQEGRETEPAPQLDICKLHGLVNCQSCRDTFGRGELAGPEAEEGWLMHRLVFDREAGYRELRGDLDQLQVIDPRSRKGTGSGNHGRDRGT